MSGHFRLQKARKSQNQAIKVEIKITTNLTEENLEKPRKLTSNSNHKKSH